MEKKKNPTQAEKVLGYMIENGGITRAEAFYGLGVAELSARIIDLEGNGHDIAHTPATFTAADGTKVHCMRYSLRGTA